MAAGLIILNFAAWAWALVEFRNVPVLLGTGMLAYSFGLRHAFDADHIAAIDNVTRKLMQENQRPVGVGLYFSLGHSTVVVLASVLVAAGAGIFTERYGGYRDIGGLIGTSVSVLFLFAIAIANIFIFLGLYRAFKRVTRGGHYAEEDLDVLLANRGALSRIFKSVFRLIQHSWQMYPLGFLFGLGFDTATEIGLLGISATIASNGVSGWSLLIFPALFTAGMALMDTLDSILMLGAYGWAFVKPIRKLYYNLIITGVSVVVALLIGSVEALGLIASKLALHGSFWEAVGDATAAFGTLGYLIVAIFVASWIASVLVYRWKAYDRIEVTEGDINKV